MAQSASRDDGIYLPPPPCESASSSTLRSNVELDRVAMALQQNSAADFLQQSQPSSMAAAVVQHQLAARLVFSSFTEMFIVLCLIRLKHMALGCDGWCEVTKLDYCCSVMVGMTWTLLRRLQSVLNAAAWLVFSPRRSDHITPLLWELHWLKITERIHFRLCVLAYRCLHGSAPSYLAETLYFTSEIEACRCLRSGFTSTLSVPATRRSSLGGRAFPVAADWAWNTLPVSLRTASSLLTFRHELKTFLFNISFPDNWTLLDIVKWPCSF